MLQFTSVHSKNCKVVSFLFAAHTKLLLYNILVVINDFVFVEKYHLKNVKI